MSGTIETERLVLRPWRASNAAGATAIYGAPSVSRWLRAEAGALGSTTEIQSTLVRWHDEADEPSGCVGHWALETRADAVLVGGLSLHYVPPGGESIAIDWELAPTAWGNGYATEAGDALIRWAMHEHGVMEVFAIVQPDNDHAVATAARIGMQWVTERGHLPQGRYQVYRIRHGDLDYHD